MSTVSIESLVRPFQEEISLPRPYYPQGQRTPQNLKLRYGGGKGSVKKLGTSESASLTTYMERHENEKKETSG